MNETIFLWLFHFSHQAPWLDWLIRFGATYLGWLVVIFLFWRLALAVERQEPLRHFLIISLAVSGAALMAFIIKHYYYLPRPFVALANIRPLIDLAADGSFPSSHAAAFMALALSAWFYQRTWGKWFLVVAIVISFSRVIAGLHWPDDILAGWLLGAVITTCVIRLFRYSR